MDYLFEHSEQLKNAALVMIDLDNLKKINDAFGHDWGDNYIRQCGKCFQENVPEKQFVRVFQEMSSIYSYMVLTTKKKYDKDLFQ